MAIPWGAIITGGASLLGSLGRDSGGDNFNSAQAFNREEAEKNRAFQLSAFQNRHQWEVEDLKKAGLNPILSAGGQPPIPSGSSAQSVNPDYNKTDRRTRMMELALGSAKAIAETRLTNEMTNTQRSQQSLNSALALQAVPKVPGTNIPVSKAKGGMQNIVNLLPKFGALKKRS